MPRAEGQRGPWRRRGVRSRAGAACRPDARLEIPRLEFSRAAACPIAARMPAVCSELDAQKTLSDEVCGRIWAAFIAPSAIICLPQCLNLVRRYPPRRPHRAMRPPFHLPRRAREKAGLRSHTPSRSVNKPTAEQSVRRRAGFRFPGQRVGEMTRSVTSSGIVLSGELTEQGRFDRILSSRFRDNYPPLSRRYHFGNGW
jgi:hypothetical protein